MEAMGIGDKQDQIWNIVAAILHLGNIEFIPNKVRTEFDNVTKMKNEKMKRMEVQLRMQMKFKYKSFRCFFKQ